MLVQVTALSVKSRLYSGLSRHSHTKCYNKGCHSLGCVGSWHQVTCIFSVLCRSTLVVTYSELLRNCNRLPQGVPIHQAQNSMLKITFADNTLWQMCEPSRRLCGKAGYCSLFSWELLFWTKNFWRSKYALHVLIFQSILVIFKHEPLMFQDKSCHVRRDSKLEVDTSGFSY